MRSLMSLLLIGLLSFGFFVTEASAKRFGGGRSFGVQRSNHNFSAPAKSTSKSMNQRANTSKWGGMLGGLLIGGLLASLFMGNGLASGLMSWLAVGAVLFVAYNFLKNRMQMKATQTSSPSYIQPDATFNSSYESDSSQQDEDFLRDAKVTFYRLQAAYDQKNLNDLRAFTTPEVLAEIQLQFQDRGNAENHTDVISIENELLECNPDSAIVRFTGMIKEDGESAVPINEIWHFSLLHNKWVVSGIQQ